MADTSCSDSDHAIAGGKSGKDAQKELLMAGSIALQNNMPLKAVEHYKSALEKMNVKASQKIPMGLLVLRYALCIALIKCNGYKHIVEAVENLRELIDTGCASRLPALYLALAKAFYALNRYKRALDFIEKGLKAIQSNSKVKQHAWPGMQETIEETGKDFLQKELLSLQKGCKNYSPPDAVCGYDQCETISDHVSPSRDIYFTDPGFKPFYYLQCDSNCQFAYHNICWEHLQDSDCDLKEPKNLLGTQCPSDKCTTNLNAISIIVEVRLIGLDGFDKPISKFCTETPIDKSAKKSCHISPSVVSNGSSVKSCGDASLRGSESGVRPAGEAPCSAVTSCQTPSDKNVEKTTTPAPTLQSNNMPTCSHASPRTSKDQRFYTHPHAGMLPLNRAPLLPASNPMNKAGYPIVQRVPYVPHVPPHFHMPIYGPQVFYRPPCPRPFAPAPAQCLTYPPTSCVEVVVGSTSVLSAGSRLLVPISPTGGPCQIKLPPVDSCNGIQTVEPSPSKPSVVEDIEWRVTKIAEDVPLEEGGSTLLQPSASYDVSVGIGPPKGAELPLNLEGDSVEKNPIKSVVEEFRRVVKQLAGEPSPNVYAKKPKWAEPLSTPETLSMRKVLDEFKRLVHEVVSDEKTAGETPLPLHDFNVNYQNLPNVNSYAATSCPSSISLPLSVTTTSYPHPRIDSLSLNTPSDHFITQSSTFQAKSKCSPLKEKQHYSHEPIVLPRSIIALYCTPLDDIRPEPLTIPDIETARKIVDKCRAVKFGYSDKEYVNPELQCFGHPFIASSSYVEPEEIEMVDKGHADFVFSYYQSMFDKDGIHRIEDLQEAWTSTLSDSLGLSKTFTDRYTNVAEFLLKSEKFAAIDDVIGTSDLLPDMFSKAEAEIAESVKYLLFTSVSNNNHRDKVAHHTNSTGDTQILNHNSNPCSHINSTSSDSLSLCPDPSKEDSDGYDQSETGKDDNDNAIFGSSSTCKSDASAMNGEHKTDLKPNFVYMSDDDEEIETSLTNDIQPCMTPLDAHEVSVLYSTPSKVCVVDHDSQTDICIDAEKQNLLEQKEILGKQVSELKYEKTELLQRIEQMESARANNESQQSNAIKIIQESLEQKLQQKIEELSEIQDKYIRLEKEFNKVKEDLKDNENQISELGSVSDKLRRTHAKEINNFVKRLQSREDEFKATLKAKDEMYIHLWKEFCEYKINKFNNLCNDRINVLSQLKDMMSDTLRPSKSDIKSSIEKYEEEMITVALKTSEVNEVYTQEKELIMAGKQTSLPSVIDLPDFKNFSYPPEGAFEYLHSLLKPKQEEFGVPRTSYPPVSRFYPRSFTSNGLQSLSQPRESEGFPSVPSLSNSSIFGQQHNETSHLWNNFTAPTPVAPSPVSFDMGNTNGPHLPLHQGFGLSGSLMQPQLNLMSNIMSYQQPSQSPSVQLMGQTRTTPSPSLPFPSMNGSAFNSNQTTLAPGAIGSKVPMVGAVQKPVPNIGLPNSNPVMKSPPLAAPVVTSSPPLAPASVSSQGAIPKPRVQAAAASMTPIVSSKPVARPLSVKGLRTNESNYEKLMRNLQKMFPTRNDVELTHALKMARDKNGNTLSSLTHSEIISKVEEILNKQAKHTSMGWEKFGKAAWGTAKAPVVEWEGSEQDECCICMTAMHAKEVYTLECKHAFHKECIRKWLLHDSVCPNCRTHSTMLDEFPPLG